jgi:menaquinone-dependent protoporphyrinogen oxidase
MAVSGGCLVSAAPDPASENYDPGGDRYFSERRLSARSDARPRRLGEAHGMTPSTMKVLVAAASRHGATAEIADAIGDVLRERGLDADVKRAEEVHDLTGYDAVVLGSAVYIGKWLGPARDLVERRADELVTLPVWLFSSGPIGDPLRPEPDEAVAVDELVATTRARGHRLFGGKLDKKKLGFGEKAVVVAFRAPDGDFRDWDEIRAWASEIAADLGDR